MSILKAEPDARAIAATLRAADRATISAATLLECAIVAQKERHSDLDALLSAANITIEPFTAEQVEQARIGHVSFGKGSGSKARLNFGDCFSYALAKTLDEPLLFKGDDFTHTDVRSALAEAEETLTNEVADDD